jgi:hypothetical protein
MKKIFFAVIITLAITGCNQAEKKENTSSSKSTDTKDLYEQNLSTLKASFNDFEKEDIAAMAALSVDSLVWNSPAYGDAVHTKKHWMETLKYYIDNWSNIHFSNAQFLPGVDSATHEFDGSVRCYGRWDGVHSSGIATQVNYYGTFEFNKDHKIVSASEFFDVG